MGKTLYLDTGKHVFGAQDGRISAFWVSVLGF